MFHVWYNFDGQVRSKLLECWYIWGITKVKSLGGVKDLTFSSRGAFVSKLKDDPGQFQGSRIIFAGDIKVEGIQWVIIIIINNNTTVVTNIIINYNTTVINLIVIAPQKKVRRDQRFSKHGHNLRIERVGPKDNGEYTCEVATIILIVFTIALISLRRSNPTHFHHILVIEAIGLIISVGANLNKTGKETFLLQVETKDRNHPKSVAHK